LDWSKSKIKAAKWALIRQKKSAHIYNTLKISINKNKYKAVLILNINLQAKWA